MLQGRAGAHIAGFCSGVRVLWSLLWLLERELCGAEVVHFSALVAAGWNFGADLVPELRKYLSGRVFLGLSMSNYMFKPTAELSLRLIQPCRRGGLTSR